MSGLEAGGSGCKRKMAGPFFKNSAEKPSFPIDTTESSVTHGTLDRKIRGLALCLSTGFVICYLCFELLWALTCNMGSKAVIPLQITVRIQKGTVNWKHTSQSLGLAQAPEVLIPHPSPLPAQDWARQ